MPEEFGRIFVPNWTDKANKTSYSTLSVTGHEVSGCIWSLRTRSHWVENPINRYNFIICLLCDRATARNHREWVKRKGAKFGQPPPTGHLPLQTLLRGETECFTSYTILYLFKGLNPLRLHIQSIIRISNDFWSWLASQSQNVIIFGMRKP